MSEIAKCPICGGVPLDKWEVTSVRVFQTGQTCCGVDCNTNERWNQYAAAMKAEARHNALVIEHAALLINNTALVKAVKWERECEVVMDSLWFYYEGKCPYKEARVSVEAARTEVERLIANDAEDCKGEG